MRVLILILSMFSLKELIIPNFTSMNKAISTGIEIGSSYIEILFECVIQLNFDLELGRCLIGN